MQRTPRAVANADPARQARLSRAFARLFAGSVVGKVLGVARELAMAASFGTSATAAAFRAAQTATIIPTHFFSSDALSSGFIPLFARYLREDPGRARSLYWSVFVFLSGIGLALTAALWMTAHFVTAALVPGFDAAARAQTASMLRVTALGIPFYFHASLASYVEMASGRYFLASIRAGVQNIGLLIGVGAAALTGNVLLLAWGFTLYAMGIAAAGSVSLVRNGLIALPDRFDWKEARSVLREFAHLSGPLLMLPVIYQGSLAVERLVGSLISTGAVASLDYAKTISETGLALIAVPLGMAGLAELARTSEEAANVRLRRLLPIVLAVTLPCSAFLVANAEAVVRLLFARGRFDEESVAVTSLILRGFALGFWANVTGYVLSKSLSARGRNHQVARITAVASGAHILVNLLGWRVLGPVTLGVANSVFGLVLFALSLRALQLGSAALRPLLPLATGAAAYLPLAWALRAHQLTDLLAATGLFLAFWTVFFSFWPGVPAAALRLVRVPAWSRTP